jgi:DNA-binding transcriptional ArsR family regulator
MSAITQDSIQIGTGFRALGDPLRLKIIELLQKWTMNS